SDSAFVRVVTGIVSTGDFHYVALYPNPVSSELTLEWKLDDHKATSVQIFSVDGRCLYSKEIKGMQNAGLVRIPVSDFAAGAYFVRLSHNNSAVTIPFMKQ
ncbi:MAG TPA: T9SS type A sorting domain-containing protein, partial [Bacteroidia bacterium]|nr:T9SS type A sorting domain-containing protein [Bacteroidia bacterium]